MHKIHTIPYDNSDRIQFDALDESSQGHRVTSGVLEINWPAIDHSVVIYPV